MTVKRITFAGFSKTGWRITESTFGMHIALCRRTGGEAVQVIFFLLDDAPGAGVSRADIDAVA